MGPWVSRSRSIVGSQARERRKNSEGYLRLLSALNIAFTTENRLR